MRQMYIDLEIKNSSSRAYLEFYIDGKRHREYNANKLNLHIFPNNAKSDLIKNKLLNKLKFEFQKAIENGWKPYLEEKKIPIKLQISLEEQVNDTLNSKLNENYSKSYKEDLKSLSKKFLDYLSPIEKKSAIETLEISRIVSFLDQFNSSNRNYMNKRQTLNVLLPNTIKNTKRKKCNEQLHEVYTKEEMNLILAYLKINYPKLHLLALLTYGCFLRPHEESRLLQKKHFRDRKIYLSGSENKGKKNRTVDIPDYAYEVLMPYLKNCETSDSYIFTGNEWLLNEDYFKTQWSRAKKKLLALSLIKERQTIYSFRHSAAVNVYKKIKDIYILQKLLGHSTILVTMKYLRGLGEIGSEDLKAAMPEL